MARRFENYRLRNGDDIGNPGTLNRRFEDIDLRVHRQEEIEKSWGEALSQLQRVGLARLDDALLPVFNRLHEIASLGAIFTARSATAIEITTGLKRLVIDEADRDRFAPAAFVAAFVETDLGKAVMGWVESYDRASGELTLRVDRTAGAGQGASWVIHAASATDNASAAEQAAASAVAATAATAEAIAARDTAGNRRDEAVTASVQAGVYRDGATAARDAAVAARTGTEAAVASMSQVYLGAHPVDPTTDLSGGPLVEGAQYWNSATGQIRTYHSGGWTVAVVPVGSEVTTVFGRSGGVTAQDGDYNAGKIVVSPAGTITATRVQAALEQIDQLKLAATAVVTAGTGLTGGGALGLGVSFAIDLPWADARWAGIVHEHTFAAITAKPTTLAGFGIGDAVATTEKGAANGVAPLGADAKIGEQYLPAVAITDTFVAATEAAMLALSAERGDLCVRSDLNKSFVLAAAPASTLANWVELRTPTDAVLSVAGRTGAVTLATGDITGLDAALAGKAATGHTHTKADVGLGSVDNTADANKPISAATQAALDGKQSLTANLTSWSGIAPAAKQDTLGYTPARLDTLEQSFTGGTRTPGRDLGAGSITLDPGNGPNQYISNTGARTITAPSYDGSFRLWIFNGAGAGALTFSGFTVSSSFGDALTTTNGHKFVVGIERCNGTATYTIKALQ